MKYLYFLIPTIFLLLLLLLVILFHFKKKNVIKKVRTMNLSEKKELLNHLAEPIGYFYEPGQDIFASRHNAPQKLFGYMHLFDLSATYLNMIFDYETFYFDYDHRTWLIEIWKGQYGINTGCELGIYYADHILSPEEYRTAHFQAVSPKDMLYITLRLNRHLTKKAQDSERLAQLKGPHWWLTIFKLGTFTKPEDLFVNVSIHFKNTPMMYQFLQSLKTTLPDTFYKVNGLTVYFTFNRSQRKYNFFRRFIRRMALISCKIYCKWFNYVTRPFSSSADKLLYLYYYLPFTVRHLLKPKKSKSS